MTDRPIFWKRGVFTLVIVGSALFVMLTLIAMFFYPGGSLSGQQTAGYSFFKNFFSELGFTVTSSGQPNQVSAALFFIALSMAGSGLALFSLAFPQFFWNSTTGKILSVLGSIFGVLSGVCFVGVAFAPANLYLEVHKNFVLWAFRLFPAAAFFYAIAIFRQPGYPKQYGWIFVAFGILLVLYILLLEKGPEADTAQGLITQATGQKIIVYASLISIMIQSFGALALNHPKNIQTNISK